MQRVDSVFKTWAHAGMLNRVTSQRGIKAILREYEDSTLDKVWGLKPQYTGKVIRRPINAEKGGCISG